MKRYKTKASTFEIPYRPPFEIRAAWGWGAASCASLAAGFIASAPVVPVLMGVAVMGGTAIWRYRQGRPYELDIQRIQKDGFIWFASSAEVEGAFAGARESDSVWLGRGFKWGKVQAERMQYLLGPGNELVQPLEDDKTHTDDGDFIGKIWIHGLGREQDIRLPLDALKGQTLILGTTRSGKTRLFDVLIRQAIARGEPTIVLDPKGDKDLEAKMRQACTDYGHPERYAYFHPGHAEDSVALDVMASWNRPTELASRLSSLLSAGKDASSDPFISFVWRVMNNFIHAELIMGKRPSLKGLRTLVEGDATQYTLNVIKEYTQQHITNPESLHSYLIDKSGKKIEAPKDQLAAYHRYYKDVLSKKNPSAELEGLLADEAHDKEHFGKMIVSLTPLLAMLTSRPLDTLLSPDPRTFHGRILTARRVIEQNLALYMGLDTLSDTTVGQAIGAIALADLAATAGEIYNYRTPKAVNIFVDEGAEVMNQPLIQLLNKGGGALFRVFLATQTLSDIATRLGSKDRANQVIGNTNNTIILRVIDPETQTFAAEKFGKIPVQKMNINFGTGVSPHPMDMNNGSYSESVTSADIDLFPPHELASLPPLHFMAHLSGGIGVKSRVPIVR